MRGRRPGCRACRAASPPSAPCPGPSPSRPERPMSRAARTHQNRPAAPPVARPPTGSLPGRSRPDTSRLGSWRRWGWVGRRRRSSFGVVVGRCRFRCRRRLVWGWRWCPGISKARCRPLVEAGPVENPGIGWAMGCRFHRGGWWGPWRLISVTRSRAAKFSGPTGCPPSTETMSKDWTWTGD